MINARALRIAQIATDDADGRWISSTSPDQPRPHDRPLQQRPFRPGRSSSLDLLGRDDPASLVA